MSYTIISTTIISIMRYYTIMLNCLNIDNKGHIYNYSLETTLVKLSLVSMTLPAMTEGGNRGEKRNAL
jgi:hypothetical protein